MGVTRAVFGSINIQFTNTSDHGKHSFMEYISWKGLDGGWCMDYEGMAWGCTHISTKLKAVVV